MHHAERGFVTRGVLLNIAALHGVRWLDRGHGVRPEELEAAEAAQGVRVRPGDALMIHTGNVEATGVDVTMLERVDEFPRTGASLG